MKPILLLAFALVGCSNAMDRCSGEFAKLESERDELIDSMSRKFSECRTKRLKTGDIDDVAQCVDEFSTLEEAAQETIAVIDKRLSEPDMQRCKLVMR